MYILLVGVKEHIFTKEWHSTLKTMVTPFWKTCGPGRKVRPGWLGMAGRVRKSLRRTAAGFNLTVAYFY